MSNVLNFPSHAHNQPVTNGSVVLTSWKAVATYMGKGVRTVQRWERDFGLPVRRPTRSDKRAIIAFAHDLDSWIALRCSRLEHVSHPDSAHDTLRQHIQTSMALRTANRLLLNEMQIALSALQCRLSEMSTPPSAETRNNT